jgi:hypothetical protein
VRHDSVEAVFGKDARTFFGPGFAESVLHKDSTEFAFHVIERNQNKVGHCDRVILRNTESA